MFLNQLGFDVDEIIVMIEYINEMEKQIKEGIFYWDCFKGIDFWCIEIVIGIWFVQIFGGQNLMGYFVYFFK